MPRTIPLRFAMEVWSVTYQSLLIGAQSPSPYLLAKMIARDCRLLFEGLASVHQVACSSTGDLGLFRIYVKFDFPPDPIVARKVLVRIYVENNFIYYTISDPMNYEQPVKLPWDQSESGLDLALARIREGQQKIISDVATGMEGTVNHRTYERRFIILVVTI